MPIRALPSSAALWRSISSASDRPVPSSIHALVCLLLVVWPMPDLLRRGGVLGRGTHPHNLSRVSRPGIILRG
jgi:hypothetical protein